MKKKYLVVAAVALFGLSASGAAFAEGLGLGIVGSPHDFTNNMWSDAEVAVEESTTDGWNFRKEICRVCHSPHDKQRTAYQAGLLWNRALSTAEYTPYTFSDKAQGILDWETNGTKGKPKGTAKMCLSCHDNTVNFAQFDSYSGGGAIGPRVSNAYMKTATFMDIYDDDHFVIGMLLYEGEEMSLAGTHPISVQYEGGFQLNDTTTTFPGSTTTIADVLDSTAGGAALVQCSSCHDVHDRVAVAGTRLLRASNVADGASQVASGLCLTCHDK